MLVRFRWMDARKARSRPSASLCQSSGYSLLLLLNLPFGAFFHAQCPGAHRIASNCRFSKQATFLVAVSSRLSTAGCAWTTPALSLPSLHQLGPEPEVNCVDRSIVCPVNPFFLIPWPGIEIVYLLTSPPHVMICHLFTVS